MLSNFTTNFKFHHLPLRHFPPFPFFYNPFSQLSPNLFSQDTTFVCVYITTTTMTRPLLPLAALLSAAALATATYSQPGTPVIANPALQLTRRASAVSGSLTLNNGPVAWGTFVNSINTTGWHVLQITTNASFSDEQQAFSAGYLEGVLTAPQIWSAYNNLGSNASFTPTLEAYLNAQMDFIHSSIAQNIDDMWWHQVALVYAQLDGLYYGYTNATSPSQALPYHAFFATQIGCDMEDLVPAVHLMSLRGESRIGALPLHPQKEARRPANIPAPAPRIVRQDGLIEGDSGHCSSLVYVTKGHTELFVAQSTWAGGEYTTDNALICNERRIRS